ncbi:MAG: site-specific DNA-methyltransferase [candidate division Zixibacteria bacterium]|nr:site-specific DNA-methyltransferase [candidate division Zixibacteria bacterium]
MPKKKPDSKKLVDSIKHKDKRVNIPTEELRDFVVEDEQKPKTMLYPRDPSLDPQLVWKGKDEQDQQDLAVPVVPIYIQEKILPQAIIEDLRRRSQVDHPDEQTSFFADFNNIKFEDMVDFYKHEQNWSNRMILGDSLLVMTSLAEKEGLKGKVQTIYIDPPYGIKFGSNWQVSTRKRDVKDGKAEDATRQPEQIRAFRDTWKLGIHSYLAYLRDRLIVARDLLSESGSIFVQIGDENVHLVRSTIDEAFGSENYIAQIVFRKTTGKASSLLDNTYDVLLWYGKKRETVKFRTLFNKRHPSDDPNFRFVEEPGGTRRAIGGDESPQFGTGSNGLRLFRPNPLTSQSASQTTVFSYQINGSEFRPGKGGWKTNLEGMRKLHSANRLTVVGKTLCFVRYFEDFPFVTHNDIWDDTRQSGFGDPKMYVVQTATAVAVRCILMTTDPGDLVLDPTCGSGTTAFVAEQWGRRWITIDTSRVALALARTRLMAAKYPYYLLADSQDGVKKEAELTGQMPPSYKTENDVRKGFVYERVPHVTLKSIANNPDIKEGMTRQEIDAAIARHAETEILYDRPYEDNKRIRVAGPFTVESLSPFRMLSTDDDRPASEILGRADSANQQFETMVIENLRKTGVQNTRKNERLKFDRLDTFAGSWIHAAGEYTDSEGKVRRVAVSIGPELGTVGPQQVKEAAKETVQGLGHDLLIVCGYAFDPHVSEEATRYGNLTVLPTRMNADLTMGDDLLKKTGAGNLFMVFGEPDIEMKKQTDGQITVELRGLDVYDPTTGEIRSSSTDDIACWFIDTDYNGESFFVRHAYFTGADEPYDKLKRALRAEVDESAWSALYSTKSQSFAPPASGKFAVKVINHYGDEVLKVFEV